MTQEHVLVTGATGFTGGRLCERLANEGYAVRALARDPQRARHLESLGAEVVRGDVRKPASLERAVEGVDRVFHIAALFRESKATYQDMWEVNAQGTQNVLDAAVAAGVTRFIHCSTIGVYGDVQNPPADEDSPFNPGDAYQETKLQGERIAQEYMRAGKLPVSIFRPAGIYGPGDTRFLKLIKPIQKGYFFMIGSGEIDYHMIYIDDLIDGILAVGKHPDAVGNIYILAGGEIVTLNQLTRIIADVLGVRPPRLHVPFKPVYLASYLCELACRPLNVSPPLFRRRVDFFRKTRSFDISKAQRELGFEPRIDLREGIRKTVQWYREQGLI